MSSTRFYRCYFSMKQRCEDANTATYQRYGAKGVRLLWPSFEEFKKDMYESYLEHVEKYGVRQTTIDRYPDTTGHYCKENCRWATYLEQARNKDNNIRIEYKGKTQTLREWADELGLNAGTLTTRYSRGWTPERIFLPERQNRFGKLLFYEFNGRKQSLKDWAKELGFKYLTLYHRIVTSGMEPEEAFTKPLRIWK